MSRLRRLLAVIAPLTLVSCAPAPPGALQGRTDLYGDPLPPGALARIGTTRFRYGGVARAVAFSPDGKTLAACGDDGIRLWDSATGKEVRRTQGERLNVHAIAFRPDGKGVIASGHSEKGSDLWGWTWGSDPQRLPSPEGPSYRFATISPDGRAVVADRPGGAGTYLLETATGKEIAWLASDYLGRAAFSADGKTLATLAREGENPNQRLCIILWDAATGKELGRVPDGVGKLSSGPFALSPDGKLAATASDAGREGASVIFWDTASGKELRSVRGSDVAARGMAFSPDGRAVALASQSGLCLREVATGKELWHRPAHDNTLSSIAFSPDGRTLAAGKFGLVRLWDVATGRELVPVPAHRDLIGFVRLSPDGRTVMTAPGVHGEDGPGPSATVFRYWDARTGMELAPPAGQGPELPPFKSLRINADLSADGKTFAAPGDDRAFRLWDVASGKELRKVAFEGDGGCCQFSPDGKLLLLQRGAQGGLCEVETGKLLGELPTCAADHSFSPDGKVLASCLWPPEGVRLLDISTRRELHRLQTPGKLGVFTFSPDGKTLAWVCRVRPEIRMWDVATGKEKAALAAGQPQGMREWNVQRLAFTPDGKWLVGGGVGGTVCFWDPATGALRQQVATGHSTVTELAFSADGKVLLTGDYETGLVWDVPELLKGNHP
jgi:WD40 repeat protein